MELFDKEKKLDVEKKLIDRWSWITEDIDNYDAKLNTCIVLENSYNKMVQEGQLSPGWLEATILNEDSLNEAPVKSTAVGSNLIPKVMFPVIRRVMPELIANKLVSVQPLTQPTGVIYYILYTYSNTKGSITATNEFSMNAQQTSPAYAVFYTSERIGPYTGTVVANGNPTLITIGAAITTFLPAATVAANTALIKRIEVFSLATQTMLATTMQLPTVGAPTFSAGNTGYDWTNGVVYLRDAAGVGTLYAAGDQVVVYVVYDQEGSSLIPEMEFSINSDTVSTTERKIKIRWTKESEQDMQAYHKIDVESELVKVASLQMNYEVDREILGFISDRVVANLSFLHDWTADAAGSGNNTSGNFLDRHRALAQKMHVAGAKVAQYNRISSCTWAVVSPQIAALLQMLPDFKGEMPASGNTVYDAGKLGSKLGIYVDPNKSGASANEILMGYKSSNTTYGAGVVYAPYTSWMSNTVTNVDNFDQVRGFFNRYALTMVTRGQWNYAKVNILNYGI